MEITQNTRFLEKKYMLIIANISIISESNNTDHWSKKRKRRIMQDSIIRIEWKKMDVKIKLPCIVALTRISPRLLDDDNLRGALKSIRDTIADLLIPGLKKGQADFNPSIEWIYDQKKGKKSLKIEIYTEKKKKEIEEKICH